MDSYYIILADTFSMDGEAIGDVEIISGLFQTQDHAIKYAIKMMDDIKFTEVSGGEYGPIYLKPNYSLMDERKSVEVKGWLEHVKIVKRYVMYPGIHFQE
jgi:hypothetical protein